VPRSADAGQCPAEGVGGMPCAQSQDALRFGQELEVCHSAHNHVVLVWTIIEETLNYIGYLMRHGRIIKKK